MAGKKNSRITKTIHIPFGDIKLYLLCIFVIFFFFVLTIYSIGFIVTSPFSLKLNNKKKTKSHSKKINLKKIFLWSSIFIIFIGLVGSIAYIVEITKDLPSPSKLKNRQIELSTKIYDRNKILLYKIYKNQNRTIVPLNEVPAFVQLATIAAEDSDFYNHPGFSVKGMLRSVIKNTKDGKMTGGSTITQQLVKNALLTPEKTVTRKIKEIILSIQTELAYSKKQILEMYLNEVTYGGSAYGIQEASLLYFGKNQNELSLAESAYLAGLTKSPSTLSPFGGSKEEGIKRGKEVLTLMKDKMFITEEEYSKAIKDDLTFVPYKVEIKAPHFVMYVKDQLVKKYGEEMVEKGGLEVITTLDYEIQKVAEQMVATELSKIARLNVKNGAAVVLDSNTGEILAMVGSKDYFDSKIDGNVNVVTSLRPPGSSIKVINYAYALSHGLTPATILKDTPVSFSVPGQPAYIPKNYDNTFRGNITLRSALAQSRNIPAVRVLASYGVDKMIELGRKMGITTWTDPSRYGLSLTLGGGDVRLLDLAIVYSTIANYGKKPELASIIKVTDYKGNTLERNPCVNYHENLTESFEKNKFPLCKTQEKVLDPRVTFMLTDILKDNKARTPAFGSNSALVIPNHPEVAVKTGTSNNTKDNVTAGYTQKYVVVAWVGNNDNSPMGRIASGITGAAPIWNKIMNELITKTNDTPWSPPQGLVQKEICEYTGTLACNGCNTRSEWFTIENQPQQICLPKEALNKEKEESKLENKNDREVRRLLREHMN